MMRTGVNMRTSEDAGPEKEGEEETRWGLYGSENGPPFPKR